MKNKKECLEVLNQLDLNFLKMEKHNFAYYCLLLTLLHQEIKEAKKPKLFDFTFSFKQNSNSHYRVKLSSYTEKIMHNLMSDGKISTYTLESDAKENHDEKMIQKKVKNQADAFNFVAEFLRHDTPKIEYIQKCLEVVEPFIEKSQLESTLTISKPPLKAKFKV